MRAGRIVSRLPVEREERGWLSAQVLKTSLTGENIYAYPPSLVPVAPHLFNYTLTLREPERIACQSVRSGFC